MERRKKFTTVVRSNRIDRARGGSVSCMDEFWKSKREEEEEKIFNKSKKTSRSFGKKGEEKNNGTARMKNEGEETGKYWKEEMEETLKEGKKEMKRKMKVR